MAARAVVVTCVVILTRVVVTGVIVRVLPVILIVRTVVMPVVGVGELIMRIAERDALKRLWRVFRAFCLAERDIVRRRIVEHQIGRAVGRRKSFGCSEPNYIRSVQQLRGATCDHATELTLDRLAARLADTPLDHTFVVAWEYKTPITHKSEMWVYFYRDVIFDAVEGVVDAPGVVRPRVTWPGTVRRTVIVLCQSG
jgi:hypothetical protein